MRGGIYMQNKILSFLSICRVIIFHEQIEKEIAFYRECQNLSQKEFDKEEYRELSSNFSNFTESFDNMVGNYLNHAYSDLYIALVETLSSETEAKKFLGIEKAFAVEEIETLLSKTYDAILDAYREGIGEVDDVLFFTNILASVVNEKKAPEELAIVCPRCGLTPDIVEAADFFGEDSKYDGKRVCCCECGAYAMVNDAGDIIGTMADKELHKKRNRVRSIISQYADITGSLYFEVHTKVANLIDRDFMDKHAIDTLETEECNKVIHCFLEAKKKIETMDVAYPKNHTQFMSALKNGMRLRIIQDLSRKRNKRLLKPAQVGDTCFTVLLKGGGTESFNFPKGLDYHFDGKIMSINHPSGNKDIYQMYPQELQNIPI